MKLGLTVAAAALTLVAAGARAGITISAGPGNIFGDENILFNDAGLTGTGPTVQGKAQQSHFVVDFSSPTPLSTPAQGQARIEGETNPFSDLTIALSDPGASFSSLMFNLNAATAGDVTITANPLSGSPAIASFTVRPTGENFFQVEAMDADRLQSVHIATTATAQDVRQVRIGGADMRPYAVPEPGTIALLAAGLLPVLGLRRRFA